MGVQMANPGQEIAVITGEASIQMNIQELSTCAQYRLTPKIVCLNNRFLGMVRQWQQIDYGSRYSESYMDSLPDFVKVAEAYGHVGLRIERPADVEPGCAKRSRSTRTAWSSWTSSPTAPRTWAHGEGRPRADRNAARL